MYMCIQLCTLNIYNFYDSYVSKLGERKRQIIQQKRLVSPRGIINSISQFWHQCLSHGHCSLKELYEVQTSF